MGPAADIVLIILAVDFGSGLLHWLEDSYGDPAWPIIGHFVIEPNLHHHRRPADMTKHNWFMTSRVLLALGAVVISLAWAGGALSWQLCFFVAIGINTNQIHKWNHLPRRGRGPILRALHRLRLLQTPEHHCRHHRGGLDTHYCVVTNILNPVLDRAGFWCGLELGLSVLFGATKRLDPAILARAYSQS
ncbi:MAG: hypothetical protein O7A03_05335 [Alphaproteobacteria bacterium]|nr:hypothetical protein [Alphaproteobacteria bacterium]